MRYIYALICVAAVGGGLWVSRERTRLYPGTCTEWRDGWCTEMNYPDGSIVRSVQPSFRDY